MAAEDTKTENNSTSEGKEASKKLEIKTEGPKDVINACEISLKDIIVQLHTKALEKAVEKGPEYTIQNSAIDGEGKNATFYGAGTHLIAAIPKKNSGLDKNTIPKDIALAMLQEYVQWFVGPDLKTALTEKDLIPLENENSGATEDTSKKKTDIEKSRGSAEGSEKVSTASKEKYKESVEEVKVPSFYSYLFEDAEDGSDSDKEDTGSDSGDSEADEDKDNNAEDDNSEDNSEETDEKSSDEASGYYISYKMHIDGQTDHPLADALKKFAKDLLRGFGFKVGSWRTGAMGDAHTIGGLMDGFDEVFGKIDAKELEANYSEEVKKAAPDSDAGIKVIDSQTIVKHLKKHLSGQDIKAIKGAEFAVCTKVNKQDKSYKIYDRQFIADKITRAIKGLFKKFKNSVSKDSVILVNNYEENKKERGEVKYTEKGEGAVKDSLISTLNGQLLTEATVPLSKRKDILTKKLEQIAREQIGEENFIRADVWNAELTVNTLKKAGINDAELFNNVKSAGNAFVIQTKSVIEDTSASMKTYTDKFMSMLFEAGAEGAKSEEELTKIIQNVFKELLFTFSKDWINNAKPSTESIDALKPLDAKNVKEQLMLSTNLSFLKNLFEDLDESQIEAFLLLEGHSIKEYNEIGEILKPIKTLTNDYIDKVRSAYRDRIKKLKLGISDKNGIDVEKVKAVLPFYNEKNGNAENYNIELKKIGRESFEDDPVFRELGAKREESGATLFKALPKIDDKTGERVRMSILRQVLDEVEPPDGKAPMLTFKVPEDPENEDKLKTLGDPIPYEEGKKIEPPDPPDYKDIGFDFDKWDPDPENLEDVKEDTDIVGKYKPIEIEITFMDVDDPGELSNPEEPTPEDKEKYKPIGDPIKVKIVDEKFDLPEIKDKGAWTYIDFTPDPHELIKQNESGQVYAIYSKDTVKITVFDADPKSGKKSDEVSSFEIGKGEPVKDNSKAKEEISAAEELLKEKIPDGYDFDGWDPDPEDAKFDEDGEIIAKYAEAYTVKFQYAPNQEEADKLEPIEVDGKEEQKIKKGEEAKAPEPPEIEHYEFDKWSSEDFKNVNDNLEITAEYKKIPMITPKAPKDPEKPEDVVNIGDPFEYDKEKPLKEQLPAPPDVDGWEPDGWDPDPEELEKDGIKDDLDITAKYKKVIKKKIQYWVVPDENGLLKGIPLVFVAIDTADPENKKKWKKIEDYDEFKSIDEVKYPDLSKVDIDGKTATSWDPQNADLEEKYNNQDQEYIFDFEGKSYFAIKAIFGPKIVFAEVDYSSDPPIIEPLEEFDPYDNVKDAKAHYPTDVEASNGKKITNWTPSPKNLEEVYKKALTDEDVRKKHIFQDPKTKTEMFAIGGETLPESLKLKFTDVDPEDPDNTGSREEIGTISIVDGKYKAAELKEYAKSETNKAKKKNFEDAAKNNEEVFKKVQNISGFEQKHKPYKFLGWTPEIESDNKEEKPLMTIEEIIAKCSNVDTDEPVVVTAVYSNDIKAHRTELDFYIVPMPGLKIKDKLSEQK